MIIWANQRGSERESERERAARNNKWRERDNEKENSDFLFMRGVLCFQTALHYEQKLYHKCNVRARRKNIATIRKKIEQKRKKPKWKAIDSVWKLHASLATENRLFAVAVWMTANNLYFISNETRIASCIFLFILSKRFATSLARQ